MTDYERIEKAILYIRENFQQQPDLDVVAKQVYLSPFHFQRLFKEWAGVSPKKFLQYITVEYAKGLLKNDLSLFDATIETGLSATSRLHDLFLSIEGMTPGEYKNGGKNLLIRYSFASTVFGDVVLASTDKGLCHLSFIINKEDAKAMLVALFPHAHFIQEIDQMQANALKFFTGDWNDLQKVKLHLKGTAFQVKVWQSLLKIPFGKMSTYSSIANSILQPSASRAVGTAVGANPVAFLIPCLRVIRSTGVIGEYLWGSARKTAILGWEAAHVAVPEENEMVR
jgi:AraC family transcriptional regulator of adaptative response/methylated-DNA-[protein]-cysteine methyltransferase